MGCAECKVELPQGREQFCSKSCATRHHNRIAPKRKRKVRVCKACPNEPNRNTSYCAACIEKGLHLQTKRLEDMLTDSSRKSHLLRTRSHRCEECGIFEWLGVPAPLELDHADGNSDNNTEENLRLLCPNCHALTPSAKGRNRGRGRTRQRAKNERYAQGLKY